MAPLTTSEAVEDVSSDSEKTAFDSEVISIAAEIILSIFDFVIDSSQFVSPGHFLLNLGLSVHLAA